MGDLISREAFKEALLERGFFPSIVKRALEKAQTVDAVEVVWCDECKYKEDCIIRNEFMGREPILELNTYEYPPIEFCSYGERKEDG